ncbi:zinc finger BED domain-containing protein 4 [Drosophila biarmipes]|uniref:zinc finger BED domain-containing protein 4 n=1 Tax=Drosophila biarmipes TaxID=125945 RepID=UPI0007E89624|nr:zinc finger BED domain-containing protein 4 [Drosophila biarmipes]
MDRFLKKGTRRRSPTPTAPSPEKQDCDCTSTDSEKDFLPNKQSNSKRSKISHVWKYFKKSDDQKLAKCLYFGKEYKTSGNTFNLRDHLKRFHPSLEINKPDSSKPVEVTDKNETASTSSSCRSSMNSVASYFKRAVLYESNSKRKTDIDKALTEMVAKDVQPYNIVENEGFIKYTQVLNPRYKLPSKTHLRDVLMSNLYKETSAKLSLILQEVSDVSITCDLWTSSANASFLTGTGDFVNDFELKTASLATKKLLNATNHCSQNIVDTLSTILNYWNILNKTVCIVTDNASSMLKACEICKSEICHAFRTQ